MPAEGCRWIRREGAVHWVMTCVASEPGQWNAAAFHADLPDSKNGYYVTACRRAVRSGFARYDDAGGLVATAAGLLALALANDPAAREIRTRRARAKRRLVEARIASGADLDRR